MSFVNSKNSKKRSRSSTVEEKSFVKSVTAKVSGLIWLPAGFTKWFSSPRSSQSNGSATAADGTDSSTEDEAPETPPLNPPAKRTRFSSPKERYSQLTTSQTTHTSYITNETVSNPNTQSNPGKHISRRESILNSTPFGCLPENIRMNSVIEHETDRFKKHTVSATDEAIALKRKPLFSNTKSQEQTRLACAKQAANQVKDPAQPYFKPHLLGSPFYHGITMYGGASSSNYIKEPNIKYQKSTYSNVSKDSPNVGTPTKRMLELLENSSSPMIEAKRIPRYETSEIYDINRRLSSPMTDMRHSYKTQELTVVPSTASVMRMKARSGLRDCTQTARQIIASHSSSLSYQPYGSKREKTEDPSLGKSQSKLKNQLTRKNRGLDPLAMPESVELPTAVLRIDQNNLPKFSFAESSAQSNVITSNENFKFSSPLLVSTEENNITTPSAYYFDSPVKAANMKSPSMFSFGTQTSKSISEKKDDIVITSTEPSVTTSAKSAKPCSEWTCPDCWVTNKAEMTKCPCCGAKAPAKQASEPQSASVAVTSSPAKCTVCKFANSAANSEKCVNCEKMQTTSSTIDKPLPLANKSSTKWKCGDCWVDNTDDADKCICCGSRKPKNASAAAVAPLANKSSTKWKCGDCWVDNNDNADKCICCGSRKPKNGSAAAVAVDKVDAAPAKDWRCADCMITNNPSINKCAACGGAKPGTQPAPKSLPSINSSPFFNKLDNKMIDIVKAQNTFWECSVCLASNSNSTSTCLCCNTSNGPKGDDDKPKLTFKFGIDPKVQETNLSKKIEDLPKPKNNEESETNNNIVPKIPSFTLPTKKMDEQLNEPKAESKNEPKPSFSFLMTEQSTPLSSNIATPTSTAQLPDIVTPTDVNEKPQEVPSISFKAPEVATTSLFSTQAPIFNTQTPTNTFLTNVTEVKPVAVSSKGEGSLLDNSKPQFSFSAVKPSAGSMFTPPATTATAAPLQPQNPPAQASILGMFSQSEATTPTTASFFSKPENSAPSQILFQSSMPAAAAPAPAAPMFSFGTNQNTATAAPSSEPKKFNFTFGSSAPTPAFGAAQNTSNAFNLPTSNNTNGPSNAMDGNGISSNSLMNSMSNNGLSANTNGVLGAGGNIFNPPKEASSWPNNNDQNSFMTSTPAKPAFSFGATSSPSPFGAPALNNAPVVFGAQQPSQNMFGINQNNANQTSMFSNPPQQPAPMFGSPQTSNPPPSMGMFGAASASPFGAQNAPMSTFEAPAMAPPPAFNFGAPQSSSGVFGFGQQASGGMQHQAQQPPQQPMGGVGFNFGAAAPAGPVQFSMGSAPVAGRRMRRAVRRNPQR